MILRNLIYSILVIAIAGCGGGGSSSGGGAAQTSVSQLDFSVGRYGGTQTLTLSVPSRPEIPAETNTVGFEANVTSTNITILDADITDATASLAPGGEFSIPKAILEFEFDDGTPCRGEIAYNGRVFQTSLDGTQSGSINCGGITFRLTGSFEATLGGAVGKNQGGALREEIVRLLQRL